MSTVLVGQRTDLRVRGWRARRRASARLEADSRADPALAARIAEQRELRARLRAEFDPVLSEPIPQRLSAALAGPQRGSAVTPIGAGSG